MDVDEGFLPYLGCAQEWVVAAERTLRSGAWQPNATERSIAGDVAVATWRPSPSVSTPPFAGAALAVRLGYLAGWAAMVRLAMLAGRWPLRAAFVNSVGRVLPPTAPDDDAQVDLPGLLAAVYRPLSEADDWRRVHDGLTVHPRYMPGETAATRMAELVPGLEEFVPTLERLSADVATILTAVATNEVD